MCSREMKDSGIEWIGYVPNEWYLEKLKNLYSFEKGKNAALYTQEYIGTHKGEYPVYSGQTENDGIMGNIDTYDYEENECLFTTTVGAKVMTPRVIKGKFSLSQNCLIMKSNNNSSIKFIYYMLNPLFNYEKSLIPAYMQPSLRVSDLRRYQFYVPNIEEQQQIVNYLDKKVSQIDDIISKQKILIEKYKAYKQSIITETVTKGLNKNVHMKYSGIEWIGEIPSHWNINALNQIFYQVKCKNTDLSEQNLLSLSYGKIIRKNINTNEGLLPDNFSGYNIIEGNDIVLRLTDLQNDHTSLRVGLSRERGIITSAYITLRNRSMSIADYLYYYLHSFDIYKGFYGMGSGVRQGLTYDGIKYMKILIPPIEEQKEIVSFLNNKVEVIEDFISSKIKLIEKLESYKKSLIYECVTGKREVN